MLDATKAALLDLGVRRTTFAEVARRAGMSRATLYTHFPDVEGAVTAVLTRELTGLMGRAASAASGEGDGRARLLGTLRRVLADLPEAPLLAKALAVDTDVLVPYVVERFGAVQHVAVDLLRRGIAEGQADGSIRPGDPGVLATTVLLAVQSLVLAQQVPEVSAARDDLADSLVGVLDRGLAP